MASQQNRFHRAGVRLAPRSKLGYTLTEVLVVVGIMSVLMGGMSMFFIDAYKLSFLSSEKDRINKDVRHLTGEMSVTARQANYFMLYPSFAAADRDDLADRLTQGQSGDFLLLAFQGTPPNVQFLNIRPTLRLVGYFRQKGADGTGPVRKFDIQIEPARQSQELETLIPSESAASNFPKVLELSEGMADGRLFYNFEGKSVMVNGKIIHGNIAKRVTDTYNFTISPRGM